MSTQDVCATNGVTPIQQIIASCSGAVLTSLLTTPFDVVKVRLQAQQSPMKPCYIMDCQSALDGVCICTVPEYNAQIHHIDHTRAVSPKFKGTFDAFIKLARHEGLQSWWKGLSPTMIMAVPATVIYYTTYDQLKFRFGFKPGEKNYKAPILAGSIGRTVAVVAICPIELIRTKLQSRTGYTYTELLSVVRNAIAQNGVLSLWRGLMPMLFRDVPFSIIFWIGYENLKLRFTNTFFSSSSYGSLTVPFLSGSIAGGVAATFTIPLDVVKTHMQVDIGENKPIGLGVGSPINVMRNVVKSHGLNGLFVGLIPRVAKIIPACAIMITSYEAGKTFFSKQY